jgi:CelD/BcsL family acetyltransferase involved in cellulose biosynthesis
MPVGFDLLETPESCEPWRGEWDELAIAAGQPLLLSAWALAWWRHWCPAAGSLTVVLAREGERAIGVAPFFATPTATRSRDYRLIGTGSLFRLAPIAAAGREQELAEAFAHVVAEASPRASRIRFERIDAASPWPDLVARAWPGGRSAHIDEFARVDAPTLRLAGREFDAWFASRSPNFRQKTRVRRRRAEALDATVHLASTSEQFERGMADLARLYRLRWAGRRGPDSLDPREEAMLRDAGSELASSGQARLYTLQLAGTTVAAHIVAAAGGEVATIAQAFDPSHAEISPGFLIVLAGVEDAFRRGERRIDFGPGGQPYKYRLADANEPLVSRAVIPATHRARWARAALRATAAGTRMRRVAGAVRRLPRG